MIALLNLSVLGFSFVFHDKAKRTQQGNLLLKKYFVKLAMIPIIATKGLQIIIFEIAIASHSSQETENYFYGISKTCKYCNKETLKYSYNGIFLPSAENRGKCVSSSDPDSEFFSFNQPGCSLLIFLICEPSKRKEKEGKK